MASEGTILQEWSPDGRLLLFTSTGGPLVYSVAARTYRRIRAGNAYARWLPDSRRVLISSSGRLSVLDSTSGDKREVFAIPGETVGGGHASRDGSYLYFTRNTISGDLWTVRFDGPTPVTKQ